MEIMDNIDELMKMKRGIDCLADAIRITLGPTGRNVCLGRGWMTPQVTNDGKSVFENMVFGEPLENIGAQLIREVSEKTNKDVGSGATTSVILAQSMISSGVKYIMGGANPLLLKRGMEIAVESAIRQMNSLAKPLENDKELQNIIRTSVNNNMEFSSIIYDAIKKANDCSGIVVENSKTMDNSLEFHSGFSIERGYISDGMLNYKELGQCVYDNVDILLIDKKFVEIEDIYPILELVLSRKKPLLMITDGLEDVALQVVNLNNQKGKISVVAIQASTFGDNRIDEFLDIEALVGGVAITKDMLSSGVNIDQDMLGHAERVVIDKDTTTIIGGDKNNGKINNRIKVIKEQLKRADSKFVTEVCQSRLQKLVGNTIVLKISAVTEVEFNEKKRHIEKALRACVEAKDHGYVVGGEVSYIFLIPRLEEEQKVQQENDVKLGMQIITEALKQPLMQLLYNAGKEPEIIFENIQEYRYGMGYNLFTEKIENLDEAGIIEPVMVTKMALINSSSMAKMMLTVGRAITE